MIMELRLIEVKQVSERAFQGWQRRRTRGDDVRLAWKALAKNIAKEMKRCEATEEMKRQTDPQGVRKEEEEKEIRELEDDMKRSEDQDEMRRCENAEQEMKIPAEEEMNKELAMMINQEQEEIEEKEKEYEEEIEEETEEDDYTLDEQTLEDFSSCGELRAQIFDVLESLGGRLKMIQERSEAQQPQQDGYAGCESGNDKRPGNQGFKK